MPLTRPQQDAAGMWSFWCRDCDEHLPAAAFYPSYTSRGIAYCRRCHARRSSASRRKQPTANAPKRERKPLSAEARCLAHLRYQVRCWQKQQDQPAQLGDVECAPAGSEGAPVPDSERGSAPTADTATSVIGISRAQVRAILERWNHQSAFREIGFSPASLRRKSRAKDATAADTEIVLVVWRWPERYGTVSDASAAADRSLITEADVIPVTRREALVWRRRPDLFERNPALMDSIQRRRDKLD